MDIQLKKHQSLLDLPEKQDIAFKKAGIFMEWMDWCRYSTVVIDLNSQMGRNLN